MPFSSELANQITIQVSDPGEVRCTLSLHVRTAELELLARESAAITRRYFGRTMRMFAPLYLSNECINSCAYCGFSRENAILRVTLEIEEVAAEAAYIFWVRDFATSCWSRVSIPSSSQATISGDAFAASRRWFQV